MSDQVRNKPGSRRAFLKKSSAVAVAATVPAVIPKGVYSAQPVKQETLNIGLIGTGGRGTGAVGNSLNSNSDIKVIAMADLASDRLEGSRASLMKQWGDKGKAEVKNADCFVGPEAYQQVCEHKDVDYVIHTTPPGLRHLTLRCAVENGKHSFVEKPVCVDPSAYTHVIESGNMAVKKNLAIVSGTQYRRENSYKDAIGQLHDGIIGDVTGAFAYYCTGSLWLRGVDADHEKWGGVNGMEYQMRNWLYYAWLSGDHIAEQAVHNLDAINWGMKSPPVKAYASGGRISRTDEKYGDIYDHFSVDYDYPGQVRVSFKCRQIAGAKGRVSNRFVGTKGTMDIRPSPGSTSSVVRDLKGEVIWKNGGKKGNNRPYEQEHMDLVASIRAGKPIMEIQEVADSSMTAVIGREAAYSGQEVSFEWGTAQSKMKLAPDDLTAKVNPVRPVPVPGKYKLV
ncbi:MAG: myo-inositol 2-dehydrogenase/D-chiro-inositol 1-dehydrogenase [Mariniblastus sp.]|jgi:myo-inositol 2-dehydrogenase/D-chiro-inositol 1-dehydrogenase